MCGFLAEFSLKNSLIPKDEFIKILNLSKKRGPNAQGYWSNSHIQLGFNRLAILELSETGNQPMHSFNNTYTIVFNGEIYNHQYLRKQLQYKNFKGNSDTETITACLEEWGIRKTISLLDGMFAIVIYNNEEKTVTLVRDFAGIKPLFYGFNNKKLVAASQYDQILSHTEFSSNEVDNSVLKLYLQQHFMPAPFGLYKCTHQVLPGEIITIFQNGKKEHYKYWELADQDQSSIFNIKEAHDLIAETLSQCVQDQMLSDVPLGAFLSGGVDSPLICSFAKEYASNIQVFSIGSDSKIHDESKRTIQFANALNLKQQLWKLNAKEMMNFWDEATASLHEPLADFSILPTYLVSKLAKQNVTVALSGDGGDEFFFGYERFFSIGKNIKWQHYPALLKQAMYGFDKYLFKSNKINDVLLFNSQSKAHEKLHSRFRDNWLYKIAPHLENVNLPDKWVVYNYKNSKNERELLSRMRKAEFYGMMQKTLRKVDLASMENSLEIRVPFLQKKMIEASVKIDPLLSYGNGNKKQLLKNILYNKIPQIKDDGLKKGFSIPLSKWIREELKDKFQDNLLSGDYIKFGLEKKNIEEMLSMHINKNYDFKWHLFTLYSLLKK